MKKKHQDWTILRRDVFKSQAPKNESAEGPGWKTRPQNMQSVWIIQKAMVKGDEIRHKKYIQRVNENPKIR